MDRTQLMSRLSGAVARGVISQNAMDKLVDGPRLKMVGCVYRSQRYKSQRAVTYVNTANAVARRAIRDEGGPESMTVELADTLKPIVVRAVAAAIHAERKKAMKKEKELNKRNNKLYCEVKTLKRLCERRHDLYLHYIRKERELREDENDRLLYRMSAIMRDNLSRLALKANVAFKPKAPMRTGNYVVPQKNRLKKKYRLG